MRLLPCVAAALAVLGVASRTARAANPHGSFRQLPTGNGYSFALYDGDARRVTLFTEHPYRAYDAATETRNLAYDAYFGVRAAGESRWLTDVPVDATDYVDQTGIAHGTQSMGPVRAETYVFSPFGLAAPAVVLALKVTNVSGVAQRDAAAYALLNFHLGDGVAQRAAGGAPTPNANGEHVTYDAARDTFSETGPSHLTLRYVALGPSTHHGTNGAGAPSPFATGQLGGDLADNLPGANDSGTRDDALASFQWTFPDLAPGASQWVGVLVTLADDATAHGYAAGHTADALVQAERDQWTAWRRPPPAGLDPAETRVWRQSEAVLRMAQSREAGRGNGAIVAALPPGIWWISWVRDMAYATAALARSGHADEANRAIDFWTGAHVGTYRDLYVHADYHVSVVRYFGDGDEESDTNADGPNIEFDGFGLATWAAHAAGRREMDVNADTLRHLLAPNGLIAADSSIWEVHWNGHEKQYGYTSIAAARGLCDAGDAVSARALRDAIVRTMVLPTGGLGQSADAVHAGVPSRDAAVVEAINFGLLDPHGALAARTLDEFAFLRTPVGRGFFRNTDGGGYDNQEWVFIDLRVADALRRMGRTAEADELLGWVTHQADANMDLQAELYHRENADYVGSIPMAGFGAGAYMLSLLDRAAPAPVTDTCFPPETRSTSMADTYVPQSPPAAPVAAAGCTVAAPSGTSPGALGLLGLVAAVLGLRRRTRTKAYRFLLPLGVLALAAVGCGGTPAMPVPDAGGAGDAPVTPGDAGDAIVTPGDGGGDGGALDGPPSVQGTIPVRSCRTSFVYDLGHQAQHVDVAGEWNMFSATAAPMSDGLGTNVYRAELDIPAGDYGYKYVADGNWTLDPNVGPTRYTGGVENSRVIVPDCNSPDVAVTHWTATADGAIELDLQYTDGGERRGPDPAGFTVTMTPGALPAGALTFDAHTGQAVVRVTGLAHGKYTFRVNARSTTAHAARELIVPMWVEDQPYEWGDGPMYFTFTDRFRDGNPLNDGRVGGVDPRADYLGGDYAGILAAMREGYFDQLGVRVIWISPPNRNSHTLGLGSDGHHYFTGYHGYWVVAPREVEPHWGSLDDLRALTAEAHHRGIRVVIDVVNNQLHREHAYYVAHMHDNWFHGDGSCICGGPGCDWDAHRTECWFTSYLPDVNYTTMAANDQMIDDAMWWLVAADLDGFRVDAVKHMEDIAHKTLRWRMSELEQGNTRYYTVGETFSGEGERALVAQYLGPHELHAQFDFPLFWRIRATFSQNQGAMADLEAAVVASETAYHGAVMSPFLGNHDVARFMSDTAAQLTGNDQNDIWDHPPGAPDTDAPYDRMALAFTFLLTQRGVPLIYYGDEIGMPGAADPDNRRMMRFGADLNIREARLLDRVRTIGHLRATHAGLRRGSRRSLYTDGDGYVYARGASTDVALVALNRGGTARTVTVPLPADLGVPDGTTLRDALGGPSVAVSGGSVVVPLQVRGSAIYIR